MRTDPDLVGILIQETDSKGYITLCTSKGVTPTTAGKFAPACILNDTINGKTYSNEGTTAVPDWNDLSDVEADEVEIADGESFDDSGGLEVLKFGVTASAVNELTITNAATGDNPSISATGGDTNIGIRLVTKGTGVVEVYSEEAGAQGAVTQLYQDSASPASYDSVGVVAGYGNNSIGGVINYADLLLGIADPTSTTEAGYAAIVLNEGGTIPQTHFASAWTDGECEMAWTDDGTDGYQFILRTYSATPASDDIVGSYVFGGKNDAAGDVNYANISGLIGDVTAGAEVGGIVFNCQDGAGSLEEIAGMANDSIWLLKPVGFEQTEQALSGADAVDVTSQTTAWSTGGAVAGTLADGTDGQLKFIYCAEATGTGTLTPTNLLGYSTIAFTAVGQAVTLYFNGTAWVVVGNNGTTIS